MLTKKYNVYNFCHSNILPATILSIKIYFNRIKNIHKLIVYLNLLLTGIRAVYNDVKHKTTNALLLRARHTRPVYMQHSCANLTNVFCHDTIGEFKFKTVMFSTIGPDCVYFPLTREFLFFEFMKISAVDRYTKVVLDILLIWKWIMIVIK